jgi:hypothetical protein
MSGRESVVIVVEVLSRLLPSSTLLSVYYSLQHRYLSSAYRHCKHLRTYAQSASRSMSTSDRLPIMLLRYSLAPLQRAIDRIGKRPTQTMYTYFALKWIRTVDNLPRAHQA